MRISLELTPPRNEELRTLDMNDTEVIALVSCDEIDILGATYKIDKKCFGIGYGGLVSLNIAAHQVDPYGD